MEIIKTKEEFTQLLKDNEKVFVDFYADWCGPCKMLAPVVEGLAKKNEDVTFVKVNVDDNSEIASQYGIMSIPALFAFKNGEVAGSTVGFQPEDALQAVIDKLK
ncbi:MAG: thioredoxin [Solobacterium sp.]|nr:thioredoxin [Solobacterium sp.]